MESDINHPKSKGFNIFLRFLQLGLSFACAAFITEVVQKTCIDNQLRIIECSGLGLIILSIIGLLVMKCSTNHPKLGFIFFFVLCLAAVGVIAFFIIQNFKQAQNCALKSMLYWYYLGQSALTVLQVINILLFPLLWIQRYTNSPGNLVWAGLFLLPYSHWKTTNISHLLLIIPGITVLISLITFLVNVFFGCKGITTTGKKVILFAWIFDLVLMLVNQGLSIKAYLMGNSQNYFHDGFEGNRLKILLSIFILVNIIDLIFWLIGILTLNYENGDNVRDNLVSFGKNHDYDDSSDVNKYDLEKEPQYGTIAG